MSEGTCMSVNLFDEVGYVQGLRASLTDLYQKPDDEQTKAEINNLIQQIRNQILSTYKVEFPLKDNT